MEGIFMVDGIPVDCLYSYIKQYNNNVVVDVDRVNGIPASWIRQEKLVKITDAVLAEILNISLPEENMGITLD